MGILNKTDALKTPPAKPSPVMAPPGTPADMIRQDGTLKQQGYFGVIKRPDGNVSTEISVGVNIGGKEVEIPTLVPNLSPQEKDWLINVWQPGVKIPNQIIQKAVDHATSRMKQGLPPFWEPGDPINK